MMKIFNSDFYSQINIDQACLLYARTNEICSCVSNKHIWASARINGGLF